MTWIRPLKTGLLVACVACSGNATGSTIHNLAGSWTASWSLSGNGPSCIINTPMTLTQVSDSFTGTFGPGTMNCDGSASPTSGTLSSGAVKGDSVAFDFNSVSMSLHQVGAFAGPALMSGTAFGSGGPYVFAGDWTAHR
jgi:hypothetical protein